MVSKQAGNIIAAIGFALLSALQFVVFVGGAKLLAIPDQGLEPIVFRLLIPLVFAFALIPILRRIGADYALAAGVCATAFFAFTCIALNAVICDVFEEKWTFISTLQSLGPVAGLLIVVLMRRAFHRVSEKAFMLIPASVLTVWLVDLAVQKMIILGFRYLS